MRIACVGHQAQWVRVQVDLDLHRMPDRRVILVQGDHETYRLQGLSPTETYWVDMGASASQRSWCVSRGLHRMSIAEAREALRDDRAR